MIELNFQCDECGAQNNSLFFQGKDYFTFTSDLPDKWEFILSPYVRGEHPEQKLLCGVCYRKFCNSMGEMG